MHDSSHDGKKRICHLLTIMTVFQVLLFLNIHLPSVAYISTSNPWVINSRPSGLLYFHFFGSFISVKHVTVNSITWRESSKDSSSAFRMASSSSSYWQKKLLVPGSGEESITQRRNESQDTLWAVPTTKWTRVPGTPRLAQNKLFLLRINIARFNTRKYIKEYFGARYFLKVLKFFIFILFSFFKNNWIFSFFFHLKILRKNLESRVQSPDSSVHSWFYTMPENWPDWHLTAL